MSQGDELKLQGEAAANLEREQGTEGGQKREHAEDGLAVAPETLHLPGFWNFEQTQWQLAAHRVQRVLDLVTVALERDPV